ncbi:MAG: hypothetical protein V4735_08990 [Pseudomonadota bacterium]
MLVAKAMKSLEQKITKGDDINPYQSRSLIDGDTSSAVFAKRTDRLWASWGIIHLHLTDEPIIQGNFFSKRSDYQVFGLVDNQNFVFLDLRRHPTGEEYSDPELLDIIAEDWPQFFSQFELNGITPEKQKRTASDIHQLRKWGIGSPVTIRGKAHIEPGFGLTSAGTSLKVQMLLMQARQGIRELGELVELDPQFTQAAADIGVLHPTFGLTIGEPGLVVAEEKSGLGFNLHTPTLPRVSALKEVFPAWATKRLLSGTLN